MKKRNILFIFLVSFISLNSNNLLAQDLSAEKAAVFQHNKNSDYFYCLPKAYNSKENEIEKYPLVIYLHGGGGYGKIEGLDYLGYSADTVNTAANTFQNEFPALVVVPQSKRGWHPDKVIPIIEAFKATHRVDTSRIYLIGYSMGGSGSYAILNGYYNYNKALFAGVIRLSGQSQSILDKEIAQNTSVWLHVGLDDKPERIEVTRNAYDFLKSHNPKAIETQKEIQIGTISGVLTELNYNNIAKIRKTEYNSVGHNIYRFPFDDKSLMVWLFNQKLK